MLKVVQASLKKKRTHFAHFPRPGENDPYVVVTFLPGQENPPTFEHKSLKPGFRIGKGLLSLWASLACNELFVDSTLLNS